MTNSEHEIHEFNKIDAYNRLKKAINYVSKESEENNFKEFMILCKTSALQGNSHAQYILGIFYEEGILGLERYFENKIEADEKYHNMIDYKKALKWYKKSATQNYKEAQYAQICILKGLVWKLIMKRLYTTLKAVKQNMHAFMWDIYMKKV